jgi:hypothetical protein
MESNEIACPQCGLVNNYLSESCVQCGIIFVKNPAMQVEAMQNQQKRKAIEEAEAILEQPDAPAENNAAENEIVMRPYPDEDTIEMEIPVKQEASEIKAEAASAGASKPEETQPSQIQEIEMEAIETQMEAVNHTMDAEELFLSEVKEDKPAAPLNAEPVEMPADAPTDAEVTVGQSNEKAPPDTVDQETPDPKQDDTAVQQPQVVQMAEIKKEESPIQELSEKAASEAAEPAKMEESVKESVESANTESFAKDPVQPAEKEIPIEKSLELIVPEETAVQNEDPHPADAENEQHATQAREKVQKKQQEALIKQALKKHREAQAKAERSKKENEDQAKAAALKKEKLAQVKAEALKKQKAAQVRAEKLKKRKQAQALEKHKMVQTRAEAMKKQKEAQVKAEASAQEMQMAGPGVPEAVLQTAAESLTHHVHLLGLLKRYKGKAIGINYDNSSEIKEAELVDANEEFFSVRVKDKKLQYSYPLKTILTIVEGQEGVETGADDKQSKFDAVIKVFPLVLF